MRLKYILFFIICLTVLSCDFEVDCRTCFDNSLEMSSNGENCQCEEGYLQIGTFGTPTCDSDKRFSQAKNGNCSLKDAVTWYFVSNENCYCSDYTQHDTILLRLPGLGTLSEITDAFDSGPRDGVGRLRHWNETEDGIQFIIDGIHVGFGPKISEFRNDCIHELRYGTMYMTCSTDLTNCEGMILWFPSIDDWRNGTNSEECLVSMFR